MGRPSPKSTIFRSVCFNVFENLVLLVNRLDLIQSAWPILHSYKVDLVFFASKLIIFFTLHHTPDQNNRFRVCLLNSKAFGTNIYIICRLMDIQNGLYWSIFSYRLHITVPRVFGILKVTRTISNQIG